MEYDDDSAHHHASFLGPAMLQEQSSASEKTIDTAGASSVQLELPKSQESPPTMRIDETTQQNGGDDDDDGDEDERPRVRIAGPNPFASQSSAMPPFGMAPVCAPLPSMAPPSRVPFATQQPAHAAAPSPPPPQHAMPPQPADECLRVSEKCTARFCFRLQWEAEMNPRCRDKTTLLVEKKMYLFDGFYILCHEDLPDIPQFEYTRGGVMCRIRFVREPLPQSLLPPREPGNPSITSPHGCQTLFTLKRYLFQQLLGIQPQHLFQSVFADPARATGDVSDYCSDFHLIPRFVSVTDTPILNKDDLLAPHRIGFAVGKFLPIDHMLGCLEASAKYRVTSFLETGSPHKLVDTIVSTWINGQPGLFRVDGLVFEAPVAEPVPGGDDTSTQAATPLPPPVTPVVKQPTPRLVHLRHAGPGSVEYDGVQSMKKFRKLLEIGRPMQISPRVDPHVELLNPMECHMTGFRADVFEVGSAMPMVLKYIRHYKLLASFENDMKITFKDKTLLRQAFTHSSYVDAAMQSVNTVEATISRVRLGHVFENTGGLKRKRTAFLDELGLPNERNERGMDPEMKRIAEQHLTTDFQPEFHSKYLCPYERLEFLGDAVLSFLVASSSFLKLPHTDGESVLHETRKDITNNAALGRVARAANFDMLVLLAFDLTVISDKTTSKIAADCMEALLGAVFTDQGIDACRALLIELMTRYDPDVREFYLLDKSELTAMAAAYVEIDRDRFKEWPQQREMRLTHRRFTNKTNVAVKNTHLWLQALTHASFKAPQIDEGEFLCTDPSYERIEFLGDAVLQLLSSEFLVDALPNYQEHLLTQARSSLVKNTRLAVVARKAGYEEFIRLGNEVKKNGKLYTEDVLADVFEASLGAVFLENAQDLGKIRSILEDTLFPLIKEAIRRREWMNPEKVLAHHMRAWGRNGRPVPCEFKKLPSRPSGEHCVALHINRFQVSRASGRTIQEAKNAACRRALQLYGIGLYASAA